MITAARILAEAAALYEGLHAVQSQSYGPEARRGATRSDVIISDHDILFPKVIQPNVVVCLTQDAYTTFSRLIRPGGLLLTDRYYVKQEKKVDARQVELDTYKQSMDTIGRPIVYNICILGALIRLIPVVTRESITKVMEKRIPAEFLEINNRALELGMTLADNFMKKKDVLEIQLW